MIHSFPIYLLFTENQKQIKNLEECEFSFIIFSKDEKIPQKIKKKVLKSKQFCFDFKNIFLFDINVLGGRKVAKTPTDRLMSAILFTPSSK